MSSNGFSITPDLHDVMECPICCLRFERPLQLSCGHSFCSNCVDRLVADARAGANRNDNFLNMIPPEPVPIRANVNRGMDQPNVNRMGGEIWMHIAHMAHPPIPGLGGFAHPQYLVRNIVPHDEQPFIHRRMNLMGGGDHIIKCPECRQPTRVPPEGLPVNFRLQEVLDRMADSNAASNSLDSREAASTEADTDGHPRCLVCNDVMHKGIYLVCLTCVGENVHQLCSMCCLRSHNGHKIEERRFLTRNDVEVARDAVSEATSRGYQSVDHVLNEFDAVADGTREYLRMSTQTVMEAFGTVADSIQFELLSRTEQLDSKVKTAQELCNKLQQLPGVIKNVTDEFHNRIVTVMDEFIRNALGQDDIRRDLNLRNSLNGSDSDASMESCPVNHQSKQVESWNISRSWSTHENKSRNLRTVQKPDILRKRPYVTRARAKQEGYNSNHSDLEADRQRRELIRDKHRNGFLDGDVARAPRATRSQAGPLRMEVPVPTSSCVLPSTGIQQMGNRGNEGVGFITETSVALNENIGDESIEILSETSSAADENKKDESVEFISEMPSALNDLEHRAEKLVISPKHTVMGGETGLVSNVNGSATSPPKMINGRNMQKRSRGLGATVERCAGNGAVENGGYPSVAESSSHRERVMKRKYGAIDPGPSSFSATHGNDNMDDESADHIPNDTGESGSD